MALLGGSVTQSTCLSSMRTWVLSPVTFTFPEWSHQLCLVSLWLQQCVTHDASEQCSSTTTEEIQVRALVWIKMWAPPWRPKPDCMPAPPQLILPLESTMTKCASSQQPHVCSPHHCHNKGIVGQPKIQKMQVPFLTPAYLCSLGPLPVFNLITHSTPPPALQPSLSSSHTSWVSNTGCCLQCLTLAASPIFQGLLCPLSVYSLS